MSADDLAHAVGIDRALQDLEHGHMCRACQKKLQALQTCIVCGKPYEEDEGGDEGEGEGSGRRFHTKGQQALDLIMQARQAGTL